MPSRKTLCHAVEKNFRVFYTSFFLIHSNFPLI